MSKTYFITATDTGVGKTFIAAGLGAAARDIEKNVGMMKPISCGGVDDAMFFRKMVGLADPIDLINPIKFKQPLSPYAASKSEKVRIDIAKIESDLKRLCRFRDIVFVEGLGGVMVPVKRNYYVADMIKDLRMPCIIIARAGLGTINHTLMTIDVLKKRDNKITGIIMNGFDKSEPSQKTNAQVIGELSGIPVIGVIRAKSSFKGLLKQIRAQKVLEKILETCE